MRFLTFRFRYIFLKQLTEYLIFKLDQYHKILLFSLLVNTCVSYLYQNQYINVCIIYLEIIIIEKRIFFI